MPSPKLFSTKQIFLHGLCLAIPACGGSEQQRWCKPVPGSTDWPSQRIWSRFNESLGGRLLQPAPPGAVCHPGQRTYDANQCPAVLDQWGDYEFHTEHPISVIWNQFSNDSCLPDQSYPCDDAGYPAFVVNATAPDHVKLGVDFARKRNVQLVVKGTGHDYIGRSIAPHALSIWTHHMKGIEYHNGSFKPKRCTKAIQGSAVTAKAGAQMMELYEFLDAYGETIVGGGAKSVGVGGYVTGGGHSLLAPRYGLAADQVLEMELVTPKGKIITANECQNEDFFWAIRGGGGSTFGVLTSVTMKTYPSPKIVSMGMAMITPVRAPNLTDFQAFILSKYAAMEAQGLSGFSFLFKEMANPFDPSGTPIAGVFGIMALQDSDDENDILSIIAPIAEEAQELFPEAQIQFAPTIAKYDSYLAWFRENYDQDEAGRDQYLGSRLLSKEHITRDMEATKQLVETSMATVGHLSVLLVTGKGVHEAEPRGGGNAVLPAWRKAIVHVVIGVQFEPLNKTSKAETIDNMNTVLDALRDYAPDSGAYMNEAAPFEADFQHAFWGDNYERLLKIKREVDPHDVFWCDPCVGNERWKEVGNKLCRV